MIQLSSAFAHLSLAELSTACKRETQHYQQGQASDSRFCLEIFRRALQRIDPNPTPNTGNPSAPEYTDEQARTVLVSFYTEYVKAVINRKAIHNMVLDDVIQQIWLYFWRAANKGLDFPSLEAALAYLKLTTVRTLIELQRTAWEHQRTASLSVATEILGEAIITDKSATPFDLHVQTRFQERCRELLVEPLDRQIFWMRYSMGIPPREIAHELTDQGVSFQGRQLTARLISDALERICRQLQQDKEIRDLLQSD